MKLLLAFVGLSYLISSVAAGIDDLPLTNLSSRKLQTTNFKASYKARFQHWADPNCADEPLVMQVFCSGDIAPVTISHASLRCKTINSGGWNGIECTTTCEESGTCEEVYLERENSENGVFAEIVFDCLGETIEEVEARAVYKGGEDGYCSQNPSSNGENFHVAQLGVSCPRDDGARSFEYDDLYFDCGFSNTARQYGNNKLTCVEGIDCAGSTCTVPFDDLTVQAEAHKFAGCIQSVSGVPVPEEPTIQPMMVPVGDYEATYEARWELSIDTTYCESGAIPTKRLTCLDGTIQLVGKLHNNINCVNASESGVLECTDTTDEYLVNSFSGVTYKCYATDQIPQTRIEVMPGEATCSSNPIVKEVAHLVQLGAVCDSGSRVWNGDSSFECGIDNDFTVIGNKFTCKESLTFLAGSQSSIATNLITIPMVEMYSDPASWDSSEMSNCYGEARAFDGGTNADVTNAPTPEGTDPCESPGAGGFGGINIGLPGFGSDDCDTKAPSTPASPTTPATSPPTSTPSPITPMTSPPTDASTPTDDSSKEPDEFTRYKTSYSTKFSHVLEEGCEGPAPMVIAFCFSGSLENIEVSDPSIVCMGPYLTDNGTAYARCSNTCIEEECESVYLNDGTNSDLWGEVTWDCIGNNVEDVHGAVFIPGSDTGTCDGFGDASPDYMGYNFMIAKLGMLCRPDDVAATDNFTNAEYLYDDRHAECMIPAIPSGSMDEYSCLSGRACQTNACTVTIEDIIIEADYYRFPQCIQTSDGSILPELPLPTSEPRATGTYSAVFSVNVQVELSMFYDEDDCTAHARGLKVSCLNGAITLYGSPEFMYCSKNGTSDVECIEKNETTPFNKWGSVVYQCSSSAVPTTSAKLMEVDTSCSADSYLQMGALCGDPGDQAFLYYDVFIECGKDNGYTNVEGNATCSESVLVNSFASEPGTISPTLIHTDYRWELLSSDICYTFKEGETPSPSDTPAPITPTSSPITPDTPTSTQETAGPTSSPTDTTVDIAIGEGDTIYSATYSARYKHILDDDCEGPAPDIAVFCLTGQLEVLDTSDDSIVCVGPLNLNGSTAALCSNTCDNEECESVYVDRGLTNPSLYGLIDFKCTGPEVDDVQGALFIPGSTTGSCSGGSGSNGFNILSASLGVSCDGQVLYDDEHTECVSGNPVNLGLDEYECISGNRCSGEACSVTIDDISFTADHFRFPECIETSDGSTVSTIDLPTSEPLPAGSYTAIFSSNVQIEVDEDDEGTCIVSATDAGLAVLRLTCLNGAIKLHRQPAFLTCAVVGATGSGTMECTEATSTLPVNEWGSVVYECESNVIPTTKAELLEVDTFCTAQSQVQLGAYCGDPGSRNFVYFDMFVECGDGSEWDNINGNYTCTETAMVNSFATVSETIPKVEIYTDYRWSLLTSDICHTYKKNERMTNSGNGVKKVYDGAKEIFGSDRRVTELKVGDFEGSDSGSVSIARSVWSAIVLAFLVGSMVVFV